MKYQFLEHCKQSIESPDHIHCSNIQENSPVQQPEFNKTPALDQYTINLTEKARLGQIDPVIGREFEIRLMLDILMRRRQNNPIITSEPGVGENAVVEGMALYI